jgi:hypothetical protein
VTASWDAHLASASHKSAVAALRAAAAPASSASAPALAPAASRPPPPAAVTAPAPAALPLGFFDDPEADARARGLDYRAAQAAAQAAELDDFMGWAASVAKEGEAEAEAELARYEARSAAGAEEAALYKARVAVLRELVEGGRLVGSGGGGEGEGAAPAAEAELLGGASLLAGGDAGGGEGGAAPAVTAAELSGLLAERLARKRPRGGAAAAGGSDGGGGGGGSDSSGGEVEDLLDWRRKGAKR